MAKPPTKTANATEGGLRHRALLAAQGEIIARMAAGAPMPEVLTCIAEMVERLAAPALCSIMLTDADRCRLRSFIAPSLPAAFTAAVDGVAIGPQSGSCGTAAWRKEAVIVTDTAKDPLWQPYAELALAHGLRACWSVPILGADGTVLGTFAIYDRRSRRPTPRDLALMGPAADLVRLALAQQRKEEALRASEVRWQLAAESGELGMFDVDLVTGEDLWSPQFKAILGLPPCTKPSLEHFRSLLHPEDRALFKSFDPAQAVPDKPFRREVLRIRRADTGEERVVVMRGRFLFDGEGAPVRSLGVMIDITEQQQRERDLAQARLAAEEANRAKGRFLASMSHELRTPLNAIIGFAELIEQEVMGPVSPPRYRGYVGDIRKSGQHLLSLINDILDMAKVESGKLKLVPQAIAPAEAAADALHLLETEALRTGVVLRSEIAATGSFLADRRALSQILLNLLSNAVKFTPAGGSATLFAHATASGSIAIGVADTGIGMDEAGLAVALEPFGQVGAVVTNECRGTGLGLPIVKSLVEAHGARFFIESALGAGTRVWAEFPPALEMAQNAVG